MDSLPANVRRKRLEIEALIAAYALSRLDSALFPAKWRSRAEAFRIIGDTLEIPPASVKNLRDEFDPVFGNSRKGWHKRPMRPHVQRIVGEFAETSDEAVIEVLDRILVGDKEVWREVVSPIINSPAPSTNPAERLRTGRRAEQFFLERSMEIVGVKSDQLIDRRDDACGFDFGIQKSNRAIEVKGIKELAGAVLFTDCEWRTASRYGSDYMAVVVGNLSAKPIWRVFQNPAAKLRPRMTVSRAVSVGWVTSVSVS